MPRIRSHFISLGMVIALAAGIPYVRAQQPTGPGGPGGRPGGPGGPGGGPGGPGGFGFGPGGRGGELSLASDPAVQEELKLTAEQKAKLEALAQTRQQAFPGRRGAGANGQPGGGPGGPGGGALGRGGPGGGAGGPGGGAGGPGGGAGGPGGGAGGPGGRALGRGGPGGPGGAGFDRQAMMARMEEQRKETEAELDKILTEDQHARLEEIALQQEGPLAVARPEIASKIDVTSAQSEKIQQILTQMQAQQTQLREEQRQSFGGPGGGGGRPDFNDPSFRAQMEKMQQATEAIRTAAIGRVAQVLTRSQKDAFNKLQGKSFDMTKLQQRGPQQRGGRRGGNPGQPGGRGQGTPDQGDQAPGSERNPE
jgi:Spy/CpxP family protein refolding chaperone